MNYLQLALVLVGGYAAITAAGVTTLYVHTTVVQGLTSSSSLESTPMFGHRKYHEATEVWDTDAVEKELRWGLDEDVVEEAEFEVDAIEETLHIELPPGREPDELVRAASRLTTGNYHVEYSHDTLVLLP